MPDKPMPLGQDHYIGSLERRVAELETLLASHGINETSNDHWNEHGTALMQASAAAQSDDFTAGNDREVSPRSDSSKRQEVLDWRDDIDPVVAVLRSLSLDANGSGYIGASSHVALGRLFNFLRPSELDDTVHLGLTADVMSGRPTSSCTDATEKNIQLMDVPAHVADRLLAGFMKHIATRFPVVHSVWLRELQHRRESLNDALEISILHLAYAAAGKFIETTGEQGNFASKEHFRSATCLLDVVLEQNSAGAVQVLMLMAIYCLRDSVGPGAWAYSRTALLLAIDHGLHRQTKEMSHFNLRNELRRTNFANGCSGHATVSIDRYPSQWVDRSASLIGK